MNFRKNLILEDALNEIISILGIDKSDKDKLTMGFIFIKNNLPLEQTFNN